jgi:adenosylcobinamide kinase / adenosylcobinamide-phosphate guanylyltransferase
LTVALTVLLGGARSGKSDLAVELARAFGAPVAFLATGEARDEEMTDRIRRHRTERPEGWTTVEEPYELARALERQASASTVVLDCLTLWVANALERGDGADRILELATEAARVAGSRVGATIAISNEVGLGIVPATPLGRSYRDLLGSVNRAWVEASDRAFLVVAGRALPLADTGSLVG